MFLQRVFIMILKEGEKVIGDQYISGQSCQAIQEWPETYYVRVILICFFR